MYTTDPEVRRKFIAALRRLADFLESHPRVPVPLYGRAIRVFAASPAEVADVAGVLGVSVKDEGGICLSAVRHFGGVTYAFEWLSAAKTRPCSARRGR